MPTRKRGRRDSEEAPSAKRQRESRPESAPSTRITRSRLRRLSGRNHQARDRVAVWVDKGSIGGIGDERPSTMPLSNSSSRRRSKRGASKRSHSVRSTTSHNTTATTLNSEFSIRTIHDPRVSGILLENNIYEPGQGKKPDNRPDNYDAIMERLSQPRPSLSPSRFPDSKHDEYIQAYDSSSNESAILEKVIGPYLLAAAEHASGSNAIFSELRPLTVTPIPRPKPDIFLGEPRASVHPDVLNACRDTIVPTKHTREPVLVNHTLEAKGPYGASAVAQTQITYNGACGARAMDSLRSYATPDSPLSDGTAQTFGATYTDGSMFFYSTHSRKSPWGNARAYYTTRLAAVQTLSSPAELRRGVTLWRNQSDMAAEERANLLGRAEKRANASTATREVPPSTSAAVDRSSSSHRSILRQQRPPIDRTQRRQRAGRAHEHPLRRSLRHRVRAEVVGDNDSSDSDAQ